MTTVRHTLMGLADTAVEAGTITEGKYLEIADYLKDSPEEDTSPTIDLNYPETVPDTDLTWSAFYDMYPEMRGRYVSPVQMREMTDDHHRRALQMAIDEAETEDEEENETDPDTDRRNSFVINSPLIFPGEIIDRAQDEATQYLQGLSRNYLTRKRENERLNNENNISQSD